MLGPTAALPGGLPGRGLTRVCIPRASVFSPTAALPDGLPWHGLTRASIPRASFSRAHCSTSRWPPKAGPCTCVYSTGIRLLGPTAAPPDGLPMAKPHTCTSIPRARAHLQMASNRPRPHTCTRGSTSRWPPSATGIRHLCSGPPDDLCVSSASTSRWPHSTGIRLLGAHCSTSSLHRQRSHHTCVLSTGIRLLGPSSTSLWRRRNLSPKDALGIPRSIHAHPHGKPCSRGSASMEDRAFRNSSRPNESMVSSRRPSSSKRTSSLTLSRASSSSSYTSLHPIKAARSSGSVMTSRCRGFFAFGSIACRVRAQSSGESSLESSDPWKNHGTLGGANIFPAFADFVLHFRPHARTHIRVQRGSWVHLRAPHADITRRAVPTFLYARSRPREWSRAHLGSGKRPLARPRSSRLGLIRRSSWRSAHRGHTPHSRSS